jgi:hypothetical protein
MDALRPGPIVPITQSDHMIVPAIVADAGDHAARRFLEFFTVNIRNPNTRAAGASNAGSRC